MLRCRRDASGCGKLKEMQGFLRRQEFDVLKKYDVAKEKIFRTWRKVSVSRECFDLIFTQKS